jgi:hypothetical protein
VPRTGPGSGPASPDRRKVLITLAFGAANVAALSKLRRPVRVAEALRPPGGAPASGGPSTPPALAGAAAAPGADHTFDVVIGGGRVVDPDTGYDRVANVGIDGQTITAITTDALKGRTTIDASRRVVAPGFIDILSYDPNDYGIWYKIGDGVTTNLGCHGINGVAKQWFQQYEAAGVPTHYGGAFDDPWQRSRLGIGDAKAATQSQIRQLVRDCEDGLTHGWLGVDFEPEYTPGIAYDEIKALAEVAARYEVPCFFHGRYSDMTPPGTNADTLAEILKVADDTGAAVHVEHITSTGGTFSMAQSIATLDAARALGVDVTACMYPYNFWATYLGSARFADGWQERFHITYSDLVIPGTGERLNATSFARYRAANKLAAAYAIPEEDVRTALRCPWIMIGSDAILEPGNNNHPRAAGCFARVLGHYVRDTKVIDLHHALRKMTILPAKRTEKRVPAMRKKGRLQRGADADITIFDPATVADRSTVQNPAQMSAGIDWVLVLGQVVKDPQGVDKDVRPGTAIKPDFAS